MAETKLKQQSLKQDTWHNIGAAGEPAYQNSFSTYGGGEWGTPSFFKDTLGFVHLRGLVAHSNPMSGYIFTLPAGYRPATAASGHIYACLSGAGIGRVNLLSSGAVEISGSISSDWISLTSITFLAEN